MSILYDTMNKKSSESFTNFIDDRGNFMKYIGFNGFHITGTRETGIDYSFKLKNQ